jgi:hypothetical protein
MWGALPGKCKGGAAHRPQAGANRWLAALTIDHPVQRLSGRAPQNRFRHTGRFSKK